MATVSSFEGLGHPTKSELRQFAELFSPLFQASSEEAKRDAVAALSQCETVPRAVASFVASQPIAIAAPFLTSSPCLDDDLLIMVARTQGPAHARAIVRRENLSPAVIDALVSLRHSERTDGGRARPPQKPKAEKPPIAAPLAVSAAPQSAPAVPVQQSAGISLVSTRTADDRDENLRDRLKRLARHIHRPAADRLGMRTITPVQEALLVRFARTREPHHFATTLADALSASRWLSERIMLDVSGRQLAVTLTGVGMGHEDAISVLTLLYPHLSRKAGGVLRAEALLTELDPQECHDRVEAWRRADSYTFQHEQQDNTATTARRAPAR
ncbi:Uncharacterized conserved protein, DUF2336 family [Rhizobium sp. RU36D]|nr:Uncharacterized conserved protein, DUF2336 family [Rhizobium sp. RU36D]